MSAGEEQTTEEWVNRCEVRVVGMSRSGNHAILHWLLEQMKGRVAFLNCVEPKTNPFATARALSDGRRAVANYDGFDLEREAAGAHSRKDWLVYNYEDTFLGKVVAGPFASRRERWVGPSARRRDVLIIRDPFNLFASRRKRGFYRGSDRAPPGMVSEATAMRIWKQHAREALGHRSHLADDRLVIRYNEWVESRASRRGIAEALGLEFDDRAATRVPRTAGGSSFDGTSACGAAHDMAVTERWRHYAEDEAFRRLFDATTLELSEELFGEIPGTRALVRGRDAA